MTNPKKPVTAWIYRLNNGSLFPETASYSRFRCWKYVIYYLGSDRKWHYKRGGRVVKVRIEEVE